MKAVLDQFFQEKHADDVPFDLPKVLIDQSQGTMFNIVFQLKPEVGGMVSGVVEAVVRHVDIRLNFDRPNYSGHVLIDLRGSRNMLELATEMADFPAPLAQLAQLYDSLETTLRFKSILHLASSDFIKQNLPATVQEEFQGIAKGDGLDPLLALFFTALFQEVSHSNADSVRDLNNYMNIAFRNFKAIHGVKVVFGNAVFSLDINLPGSSPLVQPNLLKPTANKPRITPSRLEQNTKFNQNMILSWTILDSILQTGLVQLVHS